MPLDADIIPLSQFVTSNVKFAHFAVSDISGSAFQFFQRLSRGAFGEAGFGGRPRLAWIEDWSCMLSDNGAFRIQAKADDLSLDLTLKPAKPLVIHGQNGVSKKAEGEGRASHYYSFTRLSSEGVLQIGKQEFAVSGLSWFDHEWTTNQLAANQVGWDWFSLQLDDGSDLMLFQLRTKDGGRDPNSAGTFVDANGVATQLAEADFTLEPVETWSSSHSGGRYPVKWRITIPRLQTRLDVGAALKDQELQPQTHRVLGRFRSRSGHCRRKRRKRFRLPRNDRLCRPDLRHAGRAVTNHRAERCSLHRRTPNMSPAVLVVVSLAFVLLNVKRGEAPPPGGRDGESPPR